MDTNPKVCLTTFVYGTQYQSYIPLLLYSFNRAYPTYDVIIFLHNNLDASIKLAINRLNVDNRVIINENCFTDCPRMSPLKSKALRWILWDNSFNNYDYLYTVDIDMFYLKEPLDLHIQHIEHMNHLGLPSSNLRRILNYSPWSLKSVYRRYKHAGLTSIVKFLTSEGRDYRLSGLHFVDIKKYYALLTSEKREKYKNDIYSGNYLSYVMFPRDEIFLYNMLEQIGVDVDRFGIQQNSIDMLDFNNPGRLEFRPHHGIHMGIFRSEATMNASAPILNSKPYIYYVEKFKKDILKDEVFQDLLNDSPTNIRRNFELMYNYYNIEA